MKRYIFISIILLFVAAVSAGCLSTDKQTSVSEENDGGKRISVVTTIFPQYDFTRQIAGDKADVTMLLAPGAESHSYEPTPQDIIKIQNCDVFIYVGGENDAWVDSILESVDQSKIRIIKLLDYVDPLGEEVKEGMEPEEEAPGEANDETEYDEHVWTSPQNAVAITNVIRDVLCCLDSSNSAVYRANAEKYVEQLNSLDAEFKEVISGAKRTTLVFGDRFPLRYFTECYGLDYWAAFPGCSTETEPSAATIAFLADKVKEEKIPVVFKIELSNGNVARSIAEATGAKVLTFYSCHNLSKQEFEDGATYLSFMRKNVESLKEALN